MTLLNVAQNAKASTQELMGKSELQRQQALKAIAKSLRTKTDEIMAQNKLDVDLAYQQKLSDALINRLALGVKQIEAMARACEEIAQFPQVVGQIIAEQKRADGLLIQKQRIPLGVIAMVFESRPNVVIDGAALAIKSGNAIILKGGTEAQYSNRILADVVQQALKGLMPAGCIALVETREEINELLKLSQYVDLMVPRGGEKLIQYVKEHATMPVVAHDRGLCHLYLHADADPDKAEAIVMNAKVQRPGVCNAMETLLVHENFPQEKLKQILTHLQKAGVEIHACAQSLKLIPKLIPATASDFDTEWLDLKMSLKIVKTEQQALEHIQRYGSHHTEAIVTQTASVIELFLNNIDASCLAINASTRFNDGGELGLGAELGISTSKLHAYGPMGAQEMTTTRYVVRGDGHVRN
jgi:glutamate-5-semialdehyde dehydrogenase